MTIALTACALAVVVLAYAWHRQVSALERTTRALEPRGLTGATIVVSTHPDDRTFRGVVLAEHADRLTLHHAFEITGPAAEQAAAGLVHVYRTNVSSVQQIEG